MRPNTWHGSRPAIGDLAYYIDEDKPYSGMREQLVLEFFRLFGP